MASKALKVSGMLSFVLTVILAVSGIVRAEWIDPSAGWAGQYQASVGLPAVNTPAWSGSCVASINATGDNGNPTLYMDMDATGSSYYYGPGSGTSSDKITIQFRLNTLDTSLASDVMQFHFRVYRPLATGGSQMWTYQFSKDTLKVEGNNAWLVSFDEGWHDWRITIDAATLEANIYMDGDTDSSFTHNGKLYSATTVRNRIDFGRGASTILGEADLTYIKWTNSEIVVPEPATMILLGIGAIGIFARKRK